MDTHLDGFETHTATSTTGSQEASGITEPLEVLGLVIIAHPDQQRVGEEAPLRELVFGRSAAISRREPLFLAPGSELAPRPLADSHLSRRPIRISPGSEPGDVVVHPEGPTSVRLDGEILDAPRSLSASEIAEGVVLILAGRIALLVQPVLAMTGKDVDFGLVGASRAIQRLRREIRAAALLDVPVLLRGETGTGKELVARAVHDARAVHNSGKGAGPFLAVNLGALVPALAASELFGATRGAYTGADKKREGYFRRAHTGTLFLDEIGEAPVEVQVMLLRTLETGRVQAVGGVEETEVKVHLVAATDADLEAAIREGRFRSALLHRLAGYEIQVPPLRQRRDDIARLFFHFLDLESEGLGVSPGPAGESTTRRKQRAWPSAGIMERLVLHTWPGNVRELKNVARRLAVYRHVEGAVDPSDLLDQLLRHIESGITPQASPQSNRPSVQISETRGKPGPRRLGSDVGAEELVETLERHDWCPGPAAKALGLSRPAIYRLIDQHPDLRTAADIDKAEMEAALEEEADSINAAARRLRVSPQGLRRRLSELRRKDR